MTKDKNIYKIIVLTSVGLFFLAMTIYGFPAMLDSVAQTRLDMPLDDANCIADFNEQMKGLELK